MPGKAEVLSRGQRTENGRKQMMERKPVTRNRQLRTEDLRGAKQIQSCEVLLAQ
jgi:hypothetical protein